MTPTGDTAPPPGLRYEVADGIATITLDRPDALNALTVAMKEALLAAFGPWRVTGRSARSC